MAKVTIAIGTPEFCRYRVVIAQFLEAFNGDGIGFNESNFPVPLSKKRGLMRTESFYYSHHTYQNIRILYYVSR